MPYEVYIPDCVDCKIKLRLVTEIVTGTFNYCDGSGEGLSRSNLFQCPGCNKITVD